MNSDQIVVPILIIVGILVSWALYRGVRKGVGMEFHVIPAEERWVIYRNGSFRSLAGPGPFYLLNYRFEFPSLIRREYERIAQKILVRNEPMTLRIDQLFMSGIPYGLTINFWRRNDLERAAGLSGQDLADLVQLSEDQRRTQTILLTRNAFVEANQRIQAQIKIDQNAEFINRLLPIFPGSEQAEERLKYVVSRLTETLPGIGVIYDQNHTFSIERIHLDDKLVRSFSQSRTIAVLREAFPDATATSMMQMLSAVEGIDLHGVNRLIIEEYGGAGVNQQDIFMDEDGEPRYRLRRGNANGTTVIVEGGAKDGGTPEPGVPETPSAPNIDDDGYRMTPEDYRILKRIPEANRPSCSQKTG